MVIKLFGENSLAFWRSDSVVVVLVPSSPSSHVELSSNQDNSTVGDGGGSSPTAFATVLFCEVGFEDGVFWARGSGW